MTSFHIIMPAFNAEHTIKASIESVMAQSYVSWNLTVIDDGSTDKTVNIVEKLAKKDSRISIIKQENSGPSIARNNGLSFLQHHNYVAFLDADDLWHKDKLIKHIVFFSNKPKADIAYAKVQFFNDKISPSNTHSTIRSRPVNIEQALAENPACTTSNIIVRSQVFKNIGGFSNELRFAEDQEWIVRAIAYGFRMEAINKTLVYYRNSSDGLSSNLSAMRCGWKNMISILNKSQTPISDETINRANAINNRYLARRALRLGLPNAVTAKFLRNGLRASVSGFFDTFERGAFTLAAALISFVLPKSIQRQLFSEK